MLLYNSKNCLGNSTTLLLLHYFFTHAMRVLFNLYINNLEKKTEKMITFTKNEGSNLGVYTIVHYKNMIWLHIPSDFM